MSTPIPIPPPPTPLATIQADIARREAELQTSFQERAIQKKLGKQSARRKQ